MYTVEIEEIRSSRHITFDLVNVNYFQRAIASNAGQLAQGDGIRRIKTPGRPQGQPTHSPKTVDTDAYSHLSDPVQLTETGSISSSRYDFAPALRSDRCKRSLPALRRVGEHFRSNMRQGH